MEHLQFFPRVWIQEHKSCLLAFAEYGELARLFAFCNMSSLEATQFMRPEACAVQEHKNYVLRSCVSSANILATACSLMMANTGTSNTKYHQNQGYIRNHFPIVMVYTK
jgi:hypothetical protein